ncbi:hypothetical protein DICVIV_05206 [Dictyocaulus viviparus]|uniref:Uncharacterized protein n=1 Tax=Dictyocaulus viviparus TaxID=29172 RepID=A0A0D8XXT9_DICVI|nr:hypothetical protein DICVIV_05206 [Dictyocaulus viviparus]
MIFSIVFLEEWMKLTAKHFRFLRSDVDWTSIPAIFVNMRFFEKVLVVARVQFYVIYLIFQWILQTLLKLFRECNGTAKIPNGKIRVYSIIWRYKLDPEEIAKREDFVLISGYFDSIELLENSHWIIYTIEKDYVLFVLLPEPIFSYNISKYPFMFVPMYEKALAVAEVKHTDFFYLGQRFANDSKVETVFYTNTARCGSTLLGKMLNRPGISVCYGEPPSLTVLSIALGENLMNEAEIKDLLRASVHCMQAHLPTGVLCILKTQSFDARLVPLCENIPNLKHIFMFRKKALLSVEKVVRREQFLYSIMLKLYNYCPYLSWYFGTLIAGEGKWVRSLRPQNMRLVGLSYIVLKFIYWNRPVTTAHVFPSYSLRTFGLIYFQDTTLIHKALAAIILASPMSQYEKNKKMYCHPIIWYNDVVNHTENVLTSLFNEALAAIILASPMSQYEKNKKMYCHPIIWYNDVVNHTENVLTSLFNELHIPVSCLEDAMKCKNSDSQEGSFLSRQNLEHIKLAPITSNDRIMFREYTRKMEVPDEIFETD